MRKATLAIVLLWIVLVGVAANLGITLKCRSRQEAGPSLPCAAIPTRFVMEHPDCADKLLRSMNVTNVRVRSAGQREASDVPGDEGTV